MHCLTHLGFNSLFTNQNYSSQITRTHTAVFITSPSSALRRAFTFSAAMPLMHALYNRQQLKKSKISQSIVVFLFLIG